MIKHGMKRSMCQVYYPMIFSEVAKKHHARCLRDSQRGSSEALAVLLRAVFEHLRPNRISTKVRAIEELRKMTAYIVVAETAHIKPSRSALRDQELLQSSFSDCVLPGQVCHRGQPQRMCTAAIDARHPRSTFAIGALTSGLSQGSGLYYDFDFDMQIQESVCGEGSNTHFGLGPARPFVP